MVRVPRTIKKLKGKVPDDFLISIPIVGAANCGEATLFADESIEGFLKLSNKIINRKCTKDLFALKAVGSSMNLANIDDGDYVIVDSKATSQLEGKYVISIIDGMANIKKYTKDGNKIILISESVQDLPPIYIHEEDMIDYMICGQVVQVIKKPKNK